MRANLFLRMPRRSQTGLLLALLVVFPPLEATFAGSSEMSSPPEAPTASVQGTPPNVLLIVIDTLRADHLSSYGYARPTSPSIDAIAARGVRFERNRAQAPCTFPSMNSLLTSRPVETFFGQPQGDMSIPTGVPTVAEFLRAAGYVTEAVSASPIVRKSSSNFNLVGGFDRGFDRFDDECMRKDARCVNERALAQIAQHGTDKPVFLYLHYLDPHGPYRAPADGRKTYAGPGPEGADKAEVRAGNSRDAAARLDRSEPSRIDAADISHWIDLYDDEISFVDARIGEVVSAFERLAPSRGTIVALTADHGESFLEHGTLAHCRTLFDTEIHTPLIFAGVGIPSGQVRDALSENLDIMPTLLDLAGVHISQEGFTGRSLRKVLLSKEGALEPTRLQTSAFGGWQAAFDGRFKLMVNEGEKQLRLFDVSSNPTESVDLADANRPKANELRRALSAQSQSPSAALDAARETARQLRALGYL